MKDAKANTKKKKNSENGEVISSMKKMKKTFKHSELNERLHFTQDLFERLGGCPFFPLMNTSFGIHGGKIALQQRGEINEGLTGDGIYVGVKKNEWTEQRQSMLDTLQGFLNYNVAKTDRGLTITNKDGSGVPIYITIINRKYKFFENADITFWGVTEFMMPNPFDDYWKARYLVK